METKLVTVYLTETTNYYVDMEVPVDMKDDDVKEHVELLLGDLREDLHYCGESETFVTDVEAAIDANHLRESGSFVAWEVE